MEFEGLFAAYHDPMHTQESIKEPLSPRMLCEQAEISDSLKKILTKEETMDCAIYPHRTGMAKFLERSYFKFTVLLVRRMHCGFMVSVETKFQIQER